VKRALAIRGDGLLATIPLILGLPLSSTLLPLHVLVADLSIALLNQYAEAH
jgi:hypothetical protein